MCWYWHFRNREEESVYGRGHALTQDGWDELKFYVVEGLWPSHFPAKTHLTGLVPRSDDRRTCIRNAAEVFKLKIAMSPRGSYEGRKPSVDEE
jgi:hypothetical protein